MFFPSARSLFRSFFRAKRSLRAPEGARACQVGGSDWRDRRVACGSRAPLRRAARAPGRAASVSRRRLPLLSIGHTCPAGRGPHGSGEGDRHGTREARPALTRARPCSGKDAGQLPGEHGRSRARARPVPAEPMTPLIRGQPTAPGRPWPPTAAPRRSLSKGHDRPCQKAGPCSSRGAAHLSERRRSALERARPRPRRGESHSPGCYVLDRARKPLSPGHTPLRPARCRIGPGACSRSPSRCASAPARRPTFRERSRMDRGRGGPSRVRGRLLPGC